jgi:hypothetical protein
MTEKARDIAAELQEVKAKLENMTEEEKLKLLNSRP